MTLEAHCQAGLAALKADFEAFEIVKTRVGVTCRNMETRSMFNLAPVRQLVEFCEAADWVCTKDVSDFCVKSMSRVTCSQLVEDGFNRQRRAQYRSMNTARVQAARTHCYLLVHP